MNSCYLNIPQHEGCGFTAWFFEFCMFFWPVWVLRFQCVMSGPCDRCVMCPGCILAFPDDCWDRLQLPTIIRKKSPVEN